MVMRPVTVGYQVMSWMLSKGLWLVLLCIRVHSNIMYMLMQLVTTDKIIHREGTSEFQESPDDKKKTS